MICRVIKFTLYLGALSAGGAVAWAVTRPTVEGSGTPATEERALRDVTEVSVSGAADVLIRRGEPASVRVTADDNLLPLIETDVKKRRLQLRPPSGRVHPKTEIRYVVTLPALEALTVSGAGTVTAEQLVGDELEAKLSGAGTLNLREVTYKELTLNLSGAGRATVSGSAARADLKLSGAGKLDAAQLKTDHANVRVSGAGQARVWAALDLKARVSGSGHIKYKGAAPSEQKVSGAGSIRQLD